jgi:hypothetical protein
MWIKPNNPALDATKVPTAIDIAWAAGIYEGEGSARLCGRGKRSLHVGIPQKDPEILYRLRDWFGGSVGKPSGGNPCYHFDICGDRARIFLALVYHFLSVRRKTQVDATNALEFLRGASPSGMTMDQLKERVISFNDEEKSKKWSSPVFRRTKQFRKYSRDKMRQYRGTKPEKFKVVSIAERKAV